MEGTRKRPWSNLPPELLSMIGYRLHTRMDVLRFHSVCSSFCSSIPLPRRDAPRFPFHIPCSDAGRGHLRSSTVAAEARGVGGWGHADPQALHAGANQVLAGKFPEVIDSLQFRIIEICREYTLKYNGRTGGLVQPMLKVVVHPDFVWTDLDQCLVYFIDGEGQSGYWKYGDENWNHDIVVYEGKVCVVDQLGSVSQIDSSFRLRSFSLPIKGGDCRHGYLKRLVVSSGDLYIVDKYIRHGGIMRTWDFRACKLDQQCGRWEGLRSLGNSAFFLCSFAVSARELDWWIGDCIYSAEIASLYFSIEVVEVFSAQRIVAKSGRTFLVYAVDEGGRAIRLSEVWGR